MGSGVETAGPVLTAAGVRRGARRLAPVAVLVLPFGLAFGAAAVERGLAPLQALVMSATVFAGASQFAALDLWRAPMAWASLALLVLAVNARHVVLGAALAGWLNPLPPARRLLALAFLSDANFADARAARAAGARDAGLLLGGGLAMWGSWVAGTAAGAWGGASLGELDRLGVDAVMPAFFAAAVVGGLRSRGDLLPVAVAGAVAAATLDLLPAGWNVIAAALCGGAVGALRRGS